MQTATVAVPVVPGASDDVVVEDELGDDEQAAQHMSMARDAVTRTERAITVIRGKRTEGSIRIVGRTQRDGPG